MRQEVEKHSKVQPKMLANRYQLVKKLASGSMGAVYLARDQKLGNSEVALKILHSKFLSDDIVFKRFANEVIVARKLAHKNIVRIFDFEETSSGERIISMEYVAGTTLDGILFDLHGAVDLQAAPECNLYEADFQRLLSIYRKILEGVAHAHAQGILHRDLKPSNVLVTENDEPKVADFGLAAVAGASAGLTTDQNALIGTPDYMAPEHVTGERMTARSDIYSLGMLAFEMIAGRPAFIAETPLAVAYMQVKAEFPNLSNMPDFIPKSFLHLIKKATAKDPIERFTSVDEMINFLDRRTVPGDITTSLYKTPVVRNNLRTKKHSFGVRPRSFKEKHPLFYFFGSSLLAMLIGAGSFLAVTNVVNTYSTKLAQLEEMEKAANPVVSKTSPKTSAKSKTKAKSKR